MTVSAKCLIAAINSRLALQGAPSADDLARLAESARELQSVYSVATLADLPLAENNQGRLIYVISVDSHRYSDGAEWTEDFDTTPSGGFRIFSWGLNGPGQLGDGTVTDRSSPVAVVGGFTDWCVISAGGSHSVALRTNGTAWSWGFNNSGRLGDGTILNRSSPVSVVGGFADWCAVAAGCTHSLAIRTDGTAWSWGNGVSGRLGDGTVTSRSSPVSVIGGFTDWCAISAGGYHSAAIRANGTMWSWGSNIQGQLGDGTATTCSRSSPVSVIGSITDWCAIAAGNDHSVAIRTNGTAWSWGRNAYGHLGDGTILNRSSPVAVVGGFTDWCAIDAGSSHSVAIRTNGTAWSWGFNVWGRLGDNTIQSRSSPVSVTGGFTDWCGIDAGFSHSVAIRANGTAWSWGFNCDGRLGDGTVTSRSSPVAVIGGISNWCAISAGTNHSAGIRPVRGF